VHLIGRQVLTGLGAPPAVINAIADALGPLGAKVRAQPLGPADIVALIEAARPDTCPDAPGPARRNG
jgi:carbon-monoxide dehydrogenase large subunit